MADFQDPADYRGWLEINLNACLIAISSLLLALRIYARAFMTKNFGLDDGIATIAFFLVVTQSALDIAAVPYGSGAHLLDLSKAQLLGFFKLIAVLQLVYYWSTAMVRFAIIAFVPRLCNERFVTISLWILGAVNFANTLVAFVFRLTECTPVGDNFKPPTTPGIQCLSNDVHKGLNRAHAFVGLFIDAGLLALPVWIVYTRMIFSKKTLSVLLVFSFGIFAIVTGIVRIVLMLTVDFTSDITFKMAINGIWSDLEAHVGFWCSCFPAISAILRVVSYKLGLRSTMKSQPTTSHVGYYGQQGASTRGSRWKPATKDGYLQSGTGIDKDSDSQRAIVAQPTGMELHDLQEGQIYKHTEFCVESQSNIDRDRITSVKQG